MKIRKRNIPIFEIVCGNGEVIESFNTIDEAIISIQKGKLCRLMDGTVSRYTDLPGVKAMCFATEFILDNKKEIVNILNEGIIVEDFK